MHHVHKESVSIKTGADDIDLDIDDKSSQESTPPATATPA